MNESRASFPRPMSTGTPPGQLLTILTASAIGVSAGVLAGYLTLCGRRCLHRTPILGVYTAGILIGIALLSVLPDALEDLTSTYSWSTSSVLAFFLLAGGGLFLLENVVCVHEHAVMMDEMPASKPEAPPVNGSNGSEQMATGVAAPVKQAVLAAQVMAEQPVPAEAGAVELVCEPCDDVDRVENGDARSGEIEPAPALPEMTMNHSPWHRRVRLARQKNVRRKGGRAANGTWWNLGSEDGCECCEDGAGGVNGASRAGSSGTGGLPASSYRAAATSAARLLAWLLHATIDGMVLASISSLHTFAAAAFAVLVCAMQDALAFAVVLERLQLRRHACAMPALVLFALSFPLGAGLATASAHSLGDGDGHQALALLRVATASIFCYMAIELLPAHTHRRLLNLAYMCTFTLGLATAGSSELVERLTTRAA